MTSTFLKVMYFIVSMEKIGFIPNVAGHILKKCMLHALNIQIKPYVGTVCYVLC